jgi:hypothetical protein
MSNRDDIIRARTLRRVLRNLEGVSIAIRAALPAPHPNPPHKGEGEEKP